MARFERAVLYMALLGIAYEAIWSRGGEAMPLEVRLTLSVLILIILIVLVLKAFWLDRNIAKSSGKSIATKNLETNSGSSVIVNLKIDTSDIDKMNTEQLDTLKEILSKVQSNPQD